MRKIIVVLSLLIAFTAISYGKTTSSVSQVWNYTANLDSMDVSSSESSSYTVYSQSFPFDADSLFVIGVYQSTYGRSYTTGSLYALTVPDSISIEVKLQPVSPEGTVNEACTYSNTTALIFMDTIAWHSGIILQRGIISSGYVDIATHNRGFTTYRLWMQVKNISPHFRQHFHIKFYTIRKWIN